MSRHSEFQYEWPNGARIAVVLQLPFEWWDGDNVLNIVPNISDDKVPEGATDMLGRSGIEYAGNVGWWRVLELVNRYELPGTAVVNGRMIEAYPDALPAFVDSPLKREVCAHSWRQNDVSYTLEREEFRTLVRRCADLIENQVGKRPVGWVSPAGQFVEETVEVLAEEGFLYHGDYADTDSGRVIQIDDRRIVAQPIPWIVNDGYQYSFVMNAPSAFVEFFKREFDVLYREGGQVIGAVAHANIYGRPFGISALEEVIQYAVRHSGVWFATREEIAELILQQRSG